MQGSCSSEQEEEQEDGGEAIPGSNLCRDGASEEVVRAPGDEPQQSDGKQVRNERQRDELPCHGIFTGAAAGPYDKRCEDDDESRRRDPCAVVGDCCAFAPSGRTNSFNHG